MANDFKLQRFVDRKGTTGDVGDWPSKVQQCVLGLKRANDIQETRGATGMVLNVCL